jgi:hypothetical protein
MSRQPPVIAEWLLVRLGASDALIGDLHETFLTQPSRLWYWREVTMVVFIAVRCSILQSSLRAFRNAVGVAGVVSAFGYTVASGPTVDVTTGVKVDVLSSGWTEVEAVAGQTKLVPAISVRLTNVSVESLPVLHVNAVFHHGDDDDEWGNAFRRAAGSSGLAPGKTTGDIFMQSQRGYTGTEAAADMLVNSHFIDARVDLFGKYASAPWVKLGEYAITRTWLLPPSKRTRP